MKNRKGFVLLETLVVTIFTLIIFTLLYTSTVPLLGKYKDLSYYNDIDITYDLYYLKRLIKNDSNYNNINNSSYQSIKCTDLEDANTCNSYFNALNVNKNDELIYLDLKELNANKKYLSSDILDYVNRIDKKYDNSKILILKRNDYISFVKWFEPTEPEIKYEVIGDKDDSCGYKDSATVKITCNSPDGFKSFQVGDEEVENLENLKSKTIEKTISSSTSFQVTCTSKYDLIDSDSSDEFTVCEYKSTGTCAEYETYKCCDSHNYNYTCTCFKKSNGSCTRNNIGTKTLTSYSSNSNDVCKSYCISKTSKQDTTECGYNGSYAGKTCKEYTTCKSSTCKTYEQAWVKK